MIDEVLRFWPPGAQQKVAKLVAQLRELEITAFDAERFSAEEWKAVAFIAQVRPPGPSERLVVIRECRRIANGRNN